MKLIILRNDLILNDMIKHVLRKGETPRVDRGQIADAIVKLLTPQLREISNEITIVSKKSCSIYIDVVVTNKKHIPKVRKIFKQYGAKGTDIRTDGKDIWMYVDRDFIAAQDINYTTHL